MRFSKDMWVLAFLFLVLMVTGIYFANPAPDEESDLSSTYNTGKKGVSAFYTLLNERLKYRTDRLKKAYTDMPANARMLFVVQPVNEISISNPLDPSTKISETEQDHLVEWVKKGGIAIFMSDDLDNVPAAFGSTHQTGRGFIYAFNSRNTITNTGMHDYHNAVDLLKLIDKHATKNDLILFDEYHHGLGLKESDPLITALLELSDRHMKLAVGLLAAIGLVMVYSKGRRFGAVRRLPTSETVRPGFEFVESVARLYRKAKASDAAAEILQQSFRHALCAKLGLPGDASSSDIVRRAGSDNDDDLARRLGRVLVPVNTLGAGQKLSEPELLNIAIDISRLEQELGLGRYDA